MPSKPTLRPEQVSAILTPFGVKLSDHQIAAFSKYLDLIIRWNRVISLTAVNDPEEIVERHFGESIFAASIVPLHGRLADVGSGAGFPGVPLKILAPEMEVLLLEPNLKKSVFLIEVCAALDLKRIEITRRRYEDKPPHFELFDINRFSSIGRLQTDAALGPARIKKRWPSGLMAGRTRRYCPSQGRRLELVFADTRSGFTATSCSHRADTTVILDDARRANVPRGTMFHVKQLLLGSDSVKLRSIRWVPTQVGGLSRIIAVANQKGGVGKTTTAINLATSLAASENRTLIIDSDPQGNTTTGIGFAKDPSRRTLYHAMILGESPSRALLNTQVAGLDIIPSDKNLAGAAVELVGLEKREFRLQQLLEEIRSSYAYIVIDCPPTLDLLTLNALVASDSVLIPIQCEYFAMEGVAELLDTLMRVRRTLNPDLAVEGILLTMYDDRTTLSRQVAADLRSFFGSQVFETTIPRNVRLAEAPSHGKPIHMYDIHSKGAEAYTQLAKEVLANEQKRAGAGVRSANS